MKKIIYFLLILNLGLLSCVDDASVRVMPEFNCKDTKVNLAKSGGFFCYVAVIYQCRSGCCTVRSRMAFCRCKFKKCCLHGLDTK